MAASGSIAITAKRERILQEPCISVTSLGGDAEATLAMIRSGDSAR